MIRERQTDAIRRAYRAREGDSSPLSHAVMEAAGVIGVAAALGILEQCVLRNRASWLENAMPRFRRKPDPLQDAFRIF